MFLSFIRTILPSTMLCENTRTIDLTNMGLAHFKIFFRLFKNWGRVGKGIVKFCHPLQVADFSMLLVQNSKRYVNIMTSDSILCVFLLKTDM